MLYLDLLFFDTRKAFFCLRNGRCISNLFQDDFLTHRILNPLSLEKVVISGKSQ